MEIGGIEDFEIKLLLIIVNILFILMFPTKVQHYYINQENYSWNYRNTTIQFTCYNKFISLSWTKKSSLR